MTLLVQLCIVLAALGLVAVEIVVVRALLHTRRVAADLSRLTDSTERALVRLDALAEASHELVESVRTVVEPLQRASGTLAVVGERAARVSADVMDGIEPPVRLVAAFGRVLRANGLPWLERMIGRSERPSATPTSDDLGRPRASGVDPQ